MLDSVKNFTSHSVELFITLHRTHILRAFKSAKYANSRYIQCTQRFCHHFPSFLKLHAYKKEFALHFITLCHHSGTVAISIYKKENLKFFENIGALSMYLYLQIISYLVIKRWLCFKSTLKGIHQEIRKYQTSGGAQLASCYNHSSRIQAERITVFITAVSQITWQKKINRGG